MKEPTRSMRFGLVIAYTKIIELLDAAEIHVLIHSLP
jgi:hypothetical protein